MQQGDLILVQAYNNKKLVRRIVDVRDNIILICKEEEYEKARREGREPVCVGFKYEDILNNGNS